MNKDKAIQLLERLQDPEPYEPMLTKDAYDAIQMAIDALSADGDTISRKAAIEVIDSFNVFESRCGQIKLEQMIGELPPVNNSEIPNSSDTISRAKAIEALKKDKKALEHIINGMGGYEKEFDRFVGQRNQVDYDIDAIKQLPPAQPAPSQVAKDIARIVENEQDMRVIGQERIRGYWIIRETSSGDTEARCSHCGFTTLVDEPGNGLHMVSDLNFCPNCGADMRGEQDE